MPEASERITIAAPVARVWQLLTEPKGYPSWTSAMRLRGRVAEGKWAVLQIRTGPLPFVTPVRFVIVDPQRELCWRGGIPGVVTGSHYFRLSAKDDATTELVQGERFEGLAVGPIWGGLKPQLLSLYRRTNEDLRRAAEAG